MKKLEARTATELLASSPPKEKTRYNLDIWCCCDCAYWGWECGPEHLWENCPIWKNKKFRCDLCSHIKYCLWSYDVPPDCPLSPERKK